MYLLLSPANETQVQQKDVIAKMFVVFDVTLEAKEGGFCELENFQFSFSRLETTSIRITPEADSLSPTSIICWLCVFFPR